MDASQGRTAPPPHDADFEKYAQMGAYTTPVRMTEVPDDPNHVREWFPGEFRALLDAGPLRVVSCEGIIPAATPEVFFWRPRFLFRVPVFRVLCNLLSIYGQVNALSWLGMRPRLFMTQLAVLEKA